MSAVAFRHSQAALQSALMSLGGMHSHTLYLADLSFVRRSADILVADEPTSALDADSEQSFLRTFGSLLRDRTTVLVSHRLSLVREAHCVIVLAGGRICEEGTHQQLVDRGGQYARLFLAQAAPYR